MKANELESHLRQWADEVNCQGSLIELSYDGIAMVVVFDEHADRMRVMSPIVHVDELQDEQLLSAMEANFHQALDARYAIGDEVVWSAFIHPLRDLTADLLKSALTQVATARRTFGTEYTSGHLTFGGLGLA